MIALGRRAITESEVAALIADLAQGNFFARYMAIYTCYTSHHAQQVMQALADASQIIRGVAALLVPVNEEKPLALQKLQKCGFYLMVFAVHLSI